MLYSLYAMRSALNPMLSALSSMRYHIPDNALILAVLTGLVAAPLPVPAKGFILRKVE